MKNFKNLLFLSIFILLSSCGKTIDYDVERLYLKKERGVTSFKGIPYTGVIVEYFDDEKTLLEMKGTYKDGIREEFDDYRYYKNGQLRYKRTYKDGKEDGLWEIYYENGQLSLKTTYKDGEQDGLWEFYHKNGQLYEKSTFKDGKQVGPYEYYDENGQLYEKGTY